MRYGLSIEPSPEAYWTFELRYFIADLENETFKTCSLNSLYHISKVMEIPIKEFFEEINENDLKKK